MEDLVKLYTEIYDLKRKFDGLLEQDPGDNDSLYKLFLKNLREIQLEIEDKYDVIQHVLEGLQFELSEDMLPIIESNSI